MSCDPWRERLNAGEPLDDDTLAHVKVCPACRDEYAGVLALRSSRPQPPPELRERIVAAAFRRRGAGGWRIAGWAASVAAALVVGYLIGKLVGLEEGLAVERPPKTIEVPKIIHVPVEKPAELRQTQLSTLAIALATVYKDAVRCEWKGHSCRRIHADQEIADRYPMCPLIREAKELQKTNPDLVSFR